MTSETAPEFPPLNKETLNKTLVVKGGPNHGAVMRGFDYLAIFAAKSPEAPLKVGDEFRMMPYWIAASFNSVGHEKALELHQRFGLKPFEECRYRVELIDDEVILISHVPEPNAEGS